MQHFDSEHENMEVVDTRGRPLGRIAGIEDGEARLAPKTGVQSQMGEAADGESDSLAIRPDQVVEVTEDVIRVEFDED